MYKSVILKADGSIQTVDKEDYKFTLHELYEQADCDTIQIIRANVPGVLMCIDDNGKILGKKLNPLATVLYAPEYDCIVGDVVLGTEFSPNPNDEPDIYALDSDVAADLVRRLRAIVS